ncbi:MAG: 4Fe-4S binding protein [Saprospiraceae bacterium]|nr:4Fe-4S binding protein [Saprospiraceae bacterium]
METKTNYTALLNQVVKLRPRDAVWHLNRAICESIQSSTGEDNASSFGKSALANLYGRALSHGAGAALSFSIGFAATGLRAGILLQAGEITPNLENIGNAVRSHIPLVIFASVSSQSQISQLAQSGALIFAVNTAQEAIDYMLVSYHIAEFSLIPVVVCLDENIMDVEGDVAFPSKEVLMKLAENTDHLIVCPTPSQQLIFGKSRKRIPNWFHVDNPVSLGANKHAHEAALEAAAQQVYFYHHLDEIIQSAFEAFTKSTGRSCFTVEMHQCKDADHLVISSGAVSTFVSASVDTYRGKNKHKVGAVRLVQLNPFPVNAIKAVLGGKKVITVLEQSTGNFDGALYKEVASMPESKPAKVIKGQYGTLPALNSLVEVISNMVPGGMGKNDFWIEVDFTHSGVQNGHAHSAYPKHLVLLQAIEREYPGLQDKSITTRSTSPQNTRSSQGMPMGIRKYHDQGPAYARISRFYDDTAAFYQTSKDELVADPFQAIPVMPPSTALFMDGQAESRILPVFKAENCTACGACFLHCPHAAINPVVLGLEQLIKTGINLCQTNGIKITHLIPLVKNLAKLSHEVIKTQNDKPATVSAFMPEAFTRLVQQMKMEGEKLQGARQDAEAVFAALTHFPVSLTEIFYQSRETIKKESGELFSLAIDLQSCTSCGVCASVCEEDAMVMKDASPDLIETHQRHYQAWEQSPDTGADTIIRLLDEKKYNPFSAILLSRHFNQALHGIGNDARGDGAKTMVHVITAMTEATIQPRFKAALQTIDGLIEGLSEKIHRQLGAALPSDNFDALSQVLADIKEDRNPFEEVIHKLGMDDQLKLVDTRSLKRKVELAKALKMLKWLLSEGANGTGRSRMGVATDGSLSSSGTYPWNNFTAPVLVHLNGITPELAKGLVQGHIRQLLDNIKVMRRAELEVSGSYEPEINDVEIAALSWNDLTDEEKNMVPPILIFGQRTKMATKDMDALVNMLDSSWPLKAIVLDDVVPEVDGFATDILSGIGSVLPALAAQNVTILKSSLAAPQHLFSGLSSAIGSSRPALVWVYAPSISKHTLAQKDMATLHDLALQTRAFQVFGFDPLSSGRLLSSKIDMRDNPDFGSLWTEKELPYTESEEKKTRSYTYTWADWAFTLKSWENHFTLYTEDENKAVPVSTYLTLSTAERSAKVPVILQTNDAQPLTMYRVSEDVISATSASARAWQLLREIAGELTAYPDKLQDKIETQLTEKYEAKMAAFTKEHESKIANLEREHLEKIKHNLKEKLVMLSELAREKKN